MDSACTAEAAGVGGLGGPYTAMIGVTGAAPVDRIGISAGSPTFVRIDGVPLFDQARDLEDGGHPLLPIRFEADGGGAGFGVWAGANAPDQNGTNDTTCSSWSANGAAVGGVPRSSGPAWMDLGYSPFCTDLHSVYCVEDE